MTQLDNNRRPAGPVTTTDEQVIYREIAADPAESVEVTRDVYAQRTAGPAGEQVTRSEHVHVPSEGTLRAATVARTKQIIYFVFGIISILLLLRFIFFALGASEASPFVNFIYSVSRPFALPFQGMFAEPTVGSSVLEWASLVGIAIYTLISYGLARIVDLVYSPARAVR